MPTGNYTLEEFRDQLKKFGSMKQVLGKIPGLGSLLDSNPDVDPEGEISQIEAMIDSMTLEERRNPDKIDRNRRSRIAAGSGCEPSDVSYLVEQFLGMAGKMQLMPNKTQRMAHDMQP